jgi:hypothetical protein
MLWRSNPCPKQIPGGFGRWRVGETGARVEGLTTGDKLDVAYFAVIYEAVFLAGGLEHLYRFELFSGQRWDKTFFTEPGQRFDKVGIPSLRQLIVNIHPAHALNRKKTLT